jgi:tRNA pseudouridine55 synthase
MSERRQRRGPGQQERRTARPPWRDVHGIVVVDKPLGLTSNAVLQQVRRAYRARKAGHTGSLDPMASGVLPICFGEATKLSGLLLGSAKTYEVTGRLGSRTDTGDADGEVVETAAVPAVDAAGLDAVLEEFRGEIEQVPPMYSALKHEGRRLYELARRGKTIERPPRPVTIHRLESLAWETPDLRLRVTCSKGTYVRTLVEDIGTALGSCAHVVELRRVAAGPFGLGDATALDALTDESADTDWRASRLLPVDAGVPGLPLVRLDDADADRLRHGQQVPLAGDESGPESDAGMGAASGLVRVYGPGGTFLGLGVVDGAGRLAPKRLFHLPAAP